MNADYSNSKKETKKLRCGIGAMVDDEDKGGMRKQIVELRAEIFCINCLFETCIECPLFGQ